MNRALAGTAAPHAKSTLAIGYPQPDGQIWLELSLQMDHGPDMYRAVMVASGGAAAP